MDLETVPLIDLLEEWAVLPFGCRWERVICTFSNIFSPSLLLRQFALSSRLCEEKSTMSILRPRMILRCNALIYKDLERALT